ncbi:hypothetical protein D3C76_1837120 [compost metagenome]
MNVHLTRQSEQIQWDVEYVQENHKTVHPRNGFNPLSDHIDGDEQDEGDKDRNGCIH